MTTEAWSRCLTDVENEIGIAAFRALARKTTYGDPEPGHILEIVAELKAARGMSQNDWIFNAPHFAGDVDYENPSPAFKAFLKAERGKLYKAWDSRTEEVLLIRNPAAWEWVKARNGAEHGRFLSPPPQHTGEFIKRDKIWWKA